VNQSAHRSHPPGLYVLFGAEAWERFSYYGMRALLVLYLVNQLKFPREQALVIYGTYTALVYVAPLIGGYLADRVLGRRKAILIGGLVMALGHLAMAFEPLLFPALGLLIVGNGFFKPNIVTIVGGLYEEGDARRDGAFTIFYMGINLGAFWSPIVCGLLGEKVGWHFGFSAAAVGMTIGLAQFIRGQRHLGTVGLPPKRTAALESAALPATAPAVLSKKDYFEVGIWTVVACGFVFLALALWSVAGPSWGALTTSVKGVLAAGVFSVFCFQLFRGASRTEVQQLIALIVLCCFNIFFWMGFEQAGGTMTLFADKQTERHASLATFVVVALAIALCGYNFWRSTRNETSGRALWVALSGMFAVLGVAFLGWGVWSLRGGSTPELPASLFQSINPLLIVALAPSFSLLWERLDSGRFRTSTPTKMAVGMVVLGLGFIVMFFGQSLAGFGKVSPAWLAIVYAFHTVGELCLSPIGLSMVTKLAPARVSSLAMGFWLGSSAIANYLAGSLEGILERWHTPIYGFLIVSSIAPALLLLVLTPALKQWMHEKA
jgi:POT family proton-dependent oligopeptide transporter